MYFEMLANLQDAIEPISTWLGNGVTAGVAARWLGIT